MKYESKHLVFFNTENVLALHISVLGLFAEICYHRHSRPKDEKWSWFKPGGSIQFLQAWILMYRLELSIGKNVDMVLSQKGYDEIMNPGQRT